MPVALRNDDPLEAFCWLAEESEGDCVLVTSDLVERADQVEK